MVKIDSADTKPTIYYHYYTIELKSTMEISNAVVHLLATDIYMMSKFFAEFSSATLARNKT